MMQNAQRIGKQKVFSSKEFIPRKSRLQTTEAVIESAPDQRLLLPSMFKAPFLAALVATGALAADKPPVAPVEVHQVPMLSAEEELKTIQLPDGYKLELVLSEPQIKEPVLCVFDGNGRMYVAEFLTYMQDIDGKGELEPKSRISRHESTKGDGVFDKHSVYLDNLLLPRMVLPLDDRVLVGLTNTDEITIHRDKKGNGVADEKGVWNPGAPRGGNLEHQPSGLVWGLDNWIYTTYNSYRLRWNGKEAPLKETTAGNGGQWGLAQDDYGKMWWSNAGGEKGIWNYQTHILYAAINVASQKPADFDTVWPLVGLADVQGGTSRFRPEDKTLNHFTASCGQTVFRGDRLPKEMYGNVFLPEPVGRLIRRATVEVKDGVTTVANPYGQSEFIRSTDPNFRPMNMTTGPDGTIYIVDMYRGIIQEGNWVKEGSFLRGKVKENGFENNIGKGRIWRLTHKDFKPGPQPHMLDETPAQLVKHLEHPNGWWRDTAQRMLVVKGDKSIVPALTEMAIKSKNHLARLHAFWTLEGLDSLTPALVRAHMKDERPELHASSIRGAETLIKKGDKTLEADIRSMAKDSDPSVVIQTMLSGKYLNWPDWKSEAIKMTSTATSAGVREIGSQLVIEPPKLAGGPYSKEQQNSLKNGQEIFRSLCFACHGFDGKGMPLPGREGVTLAPPLAGSKTAVQGDAILRVLLQGLSGAINGKTYDAQMVSMGTNSDQWIADVACYVRKAFGNQGELVSKNDVKNLRNATKNHPLPWTIEELRAGFPQPLTNRKDWKLTSIQMKDIEKCVDDDAKSRWTTLKYQAGGEWFQIELPEVTEVVGVQLDSSGSGNDYPRGYKVELSNNGTEWDKPILEGKGSGGVTELKFPKTVKTKFIRITQTGLVKGNFWSIHELNVLKPAEKPAVTTAAK